MATCEQCAGSGIVTEAEHAPRCDGYTCAPDCPIPVPMPCQYCEHEPKGEKETE
jgi:hypothetical protein